MRKMLKRTTALKGMIWGLVLVGLLASVRPVVVQASQCADGPCCVDVQEAGPSEWEMSGRAVLIWLAWLMLGAGF